MHMQKILIVAASLFTFCGQSFALELKNIKAEDIVTNKQIENSNGIKLKTRKGNVIVKKLTYVKDKSKLCAIHLPSFREHLSSKNFKMPSEVGVTVEVSLESGLVERDGVSRVVCAGPGTDCIATIEVEEKS